jgi:hypothetical protein
MWSVIDGHVKLSRTICQIWVIPTAPSALTLRRKIGFSKIFRSYFDHFGAGVAGGNRAEEMDELTSTITDVHFSVFATVATTTKSVFDTDLFA